jgi:hypothetical protein
VYDVKGKYTPAPLTFHAKKFKIVPFVSLKQIFDNLEESEHLLNGESVRVFIKIKRHGDINDVMGKLRQVD